MSLIICLYFFHKIRTYFGPQHSEARNSILPRLVWAAHTGLSTYSPARRPVLSSARASPPSGSGTFSSGLPPARCSFPSIRVLPVHGAPPFNQALISFALAPASRRRHRQDGGTSFGRRPLPPPALRPEIPHSQSLPRSGHQRIRRRMKSGGRRRCGQECASPLALKLKLRIHHRSGRPCGRRGGGRALRGGRWRLGCPARPGVSYYSTWSPLYLVRSYLTSPS
jgi:hypothetical protein